MFRSEYMWCLYCEEYGENEFIFKKAIVSI